MTESIFFTKFRKLLIMATLSTIYQPGFKPIKFFGRTINYCYWYCIIAMCLVLGAAVDNFLTVVYLELPLSLVIFVNAFGACYVYSWARRLFYLWKHNEICEIYEYYSQSFVPKLWPYILEEEIDKCNENAIKDVIRSISYVVGPQLLFVMGRIFWTRSAIVPTILQPSTRCEEPAGVSILAFQSINLINHNASWAVEEALIYLLFSLIVSQYDYLSRTLKKIVDVIHVDHTGDVHCVDPKLTGSGDFQYLMNLTGQRLRLWIDHHTLINSTYKKLASCFWPLVYLQLVYITITMGAIIFVAINGYLPADMTGMCALYSTTRLFMTLRLCRLAHQISTKSCDLATDGFRANWMGLPPEVINMLFMTGQVSITSPAKFSLKGMIHMDSSTFLSMMSLQYKFLTFLQNLLQKKKGV